jgi:hypothetical protein
MTFDEKIRLGILAASALMAVVVGLHAGHVSLQSLSLDEIGPGAGSG